MGTKVHIKVSKNYETHISLVGKDQADIAYLGPSPYVKMVKEYGRKPLLARLEVRNKPVYYGMIIVRKDSPIKVLADLAGKSFAFGDQDSTMSHLVPRYMLHKAGIDVKDLSRYEFLGTHHDIALAVLGGYYDAGGIKEEVFYAYQERGLKALAQSQPISEHVFVARSSMEENIVTQLKENLLRLNDHGLEILQSIKPSVTGVTSVKDADYDAMRIYMNHVAEKM
jgi:phosphonate transport system substrate-binding protein